MKIQYYGHSCFKVEAQGMSLLFDPFIKGNVLASSIDVSSISCDYILISHAHEDHIADAINIGKRTGAVIVSNFEIVTWAQENGIENVHPMNHGGKWKFDFGTLRYVNAVHSSSFPDGRYGGNPGGYILSSGGKTLYYSGDTALMSDMKMFGEIYDIDICLLPIGDNFTMGVEDASIAARYLQCSKVMGVHYDTFSLIKIDHEHAKNYFAENNQELHLVPVGGNLSL